MKHARVQITAGSISQARNIFRGIGSRTFARTTALNGDFNSIYLRGIARTTRVRRTCIYRCGERVLVLKYPWPFCLSTLLLFMYARTPLRKPDLSSAALRFLRIIERSMTFAFRGIYVLHWNFGELKWRYMYTYLAMIYCEIPRAGVYVIWLLVGLFMGFDTRWKYFVL